MRSLIPFLLPLPYLLALLSILPSLCPVGAWDWIGVVSNCTLFWRCYYFSQWPLRLCERGTGSKCHPKHPFYGSRHNTHPISSTTSKQPRCPPPPRGLWRTCSWASNIFTRWSYSLQWQMVVLTHGAWFTFRRFLWNDHVLISGASAKHCPRWTSQKEQRWLRTRYLTCVFRALNDIACQ